MPRGTNAIIDGASFENAAYSPLIINHFPPHSTQLKVYIHPMKEKSPFTVINNWSLVKLSLALNTLFFELPWLFAFSLLFPTSNGCLRPCSFMS